MNPTSVVSTATGSVNSSIISVSKEEEHSQIETLASSQLHSIRFTFNEQSSWNDLTLVRTWIDRLLLCLRWLSGHWDGCRGRLLVLLFLAHSVLVGWNPVEVAAQQNLVQSVFQSLIWGKTDEWAAVSFLKTIHKYKTCMATVHTVAPPPQPQHQPRCRPWLVLLQWTGSAVP